MRPAARRWAVLAAAALLALAACGGGGGTGPASAGGPGSGGPLRVSGSTTVNPVAVDAAEVLRGRGMRITVDSQGGSAGGIAQLGQGQVEIAMSSKPVTDEERARFPGVDFVATEIGQAPRLRSVPALAGVAAGAAGAALLAVVAFLLAGVASGRLRWGPCSPRRSGTPAGGTSAPRPWCGARRRWRRSPWPSPPRWGGPPRSPSWSWRPCAGGGPCGPGPSCWPWCPRSCSACSGSPTCGRW